MTVAVDIAMQVACGACAGTGRQPVLPGVECLCSCCGARGSHVLQPCNDSTTAGRPACLLDPKLEGWVAADGFTEETP